MLGFKFEFNVRWSDLKDAKFIVYNIFSFLALGLYAICSFIWNVQANIDHWDSVVRWSGIGGMVVVFGILILLTENLARLRLYVLHSQLTVAPSKCDAQEVVHNDI